MKKIFNEMSVLFLILTLCTIVCLALIIYGSTVGEVFDTSSWLVVIYFALMVMYAVNKEIRRWKGRDVKGWEDSVLVYLSCLWLMLYLVMVVISFFFSQFSLPKNFYVVALLALGIFAGSEGSKNIHGAKRAK